MAENKENENVNTLDIQSILSKYDVRNKNNGSIELNSNLKKELTDDQINNWIFSGNYETENQKSTTKIIDIDKYWNFYNVMSPKVDVEFLVSTNDSSKKGKWININYNNFTKNSNYNNYFVSANIVDKGFKEIELVLYDRTFTNIQRLLANAIQLSDKKMMNSESYISEDEIFKQEVENGMNLEFFTSPDEIISNLRIRYGYNEDANTTVNKEFGYKGLGDLDDKIQPRWKKSSTSMNMSKDTNKTISDSAVLAQYQQSTIYTNWDEFFITGLTSTLTDTGIKYTIKAVSTDKFALNGYKMYQQYSKLVGKPKTVLATLMNMFNKNEKAPIKLVWADDKISSTDSAINGQDVLMDYKTGLYKVIGEDEVKDLDSSIGKPINDLTSYISMLKDILACFTNSPENTLSSYSNDLSIEYQKCIGDICNNNFLNSITPSKKSYMDIISWPFNISSKLNDLDNSDSSFKNNLYELAVYQKRISDNCEYLTNGLLNNKEAGHDNSCEITIRNVIKVWLANIAIKAFSLYGNNSDGQLAKLSSAVKENNEIKEKTEKLITKANSKFKDKCSLPVYWEYNPLNLDKANNIDPDIYYFPGTKKVEINTGGGTTTTTIYKNSIYTKYGRKNIDNISFLDIKDSWNSIMEIDDIYIADSSLTNLALYKSWMSYEALELLTMEDKIIGKVTEDTKNQIDLNTNFFKDQASGRTANEYKNLTLCQTLYLNNVRNEDIINKNNKKVQDMVSIVEDINRDMENLSSLSKKNNKLTLIKSKTSDNGVNIFIKKDGKYVLNNFDINKELICAAEFDKKETEKIIFIKIAPKDAVGNIDENSNFFKFEFKGSNIREWEKEEFDELKELLIKIIKNVLQFSLDVIYIEDNGTILGKDFFKKSDVNKEMKSLESKVLEEHKAMLEKIKNELIDFRNSLNLNEELENYNTSKASLSSIESGVESNGTIKELLELEIKDIKENHKNGNLIELSIDKSEESAKENENKDEKEKRYSGKLETFGKHKYDYNFRPELQSVGWSNNFLLDAFKLVSLTNISITKEDISAFTKCIELKIEDLGKTLKDLNDSKTKIDKSNIGKEIELSLGTQESRNKDLKLTKTLSSLLNDFCSQCQPKIDIQEVSIRNNKLSIRDENGELKNVDVYNDMPRYNLTWGIIGHYKEERIPIVGLYYKEPKFTSKLRMYNWGTGNPKQHCIKGLSVATNSEFAMMHNFNMATKTSTGTNIEVSKAGAKVSVDDILPNSNEPCFFAQSFDSNRDKILFNNTLNSISKGTITLLGDPSLKFSCQIQPFTYPIYINIKLQSEDRGWSFKEGISSSPTSQLSGYYMVTQITHNISQAGYTTTLDIMRYPGSENSIII